MQPYDYTIQSPGLVGGVAQGLQFGAGIKQMQDEQAAAEQQKLAQQQMNADLSAASQDISKIPGLMVRYPQLAEKLKVGWETKSAEQQRSDVEHGAQVLTALHSGRPDLAAEILKSRAAAQRNSGDEQGAKLTEAMAQSAIDSPEVLKQATALTLAARPGGDKLIESITKAQTMPSDVAKAQAEATTAGVKAKYAESDAMLDLQKKGWDIQAVQNDIEYKKQANRIAAMNASVARESNDLKRQELALKVKDAQMALDEKIRGRAAEYESTVSGLQDAKTLISELKNMPVSLWLSTGSTAASGYIPGTGARTAAGKLEQLTNMLAAANLDKLKGPTSDKDISFVKNLSANLDRWQSTGNVVGEMEKVDAALSRLINQASKKYGAPPPSSAPGAIPPSGKTSGGATVSGW